MSKLMDVIKEREEIRKNYREFLEDEFYYKKQAELREQYNKQVEESENKPEITHELIYSKYQDLKAGIDNKEYLKNYI